MMTEAAPKKLIKSRTKKRLSVGAYNSISDIALASIGVTPMMRDKFLEMVILKGNKPLNLEEVVHLLQWVFESTPEVGVDYVLEFRQGWIDMDIVRTVAYKIFIESIKLKLSLYLSRTLMSSAQCTTRPKCEWV